MKHIVVVGGGVAGKKVVSDLLKLKNVKVSLVEPKEYFEVPYAQLRALVEGGSFSKSSRALYSDILKGVNHIRSSATGIKKNTLLLEEGSSVDFDYLVIATGSHFPSIERVKGMERLIDQRHTSVEQEAKRIKSSSSILIIGGGAVGVELAGEIAYAYPNKEIVLVERGKRILSTLDEKMSKRALDVLSEMNVKIVTQTSVKEIKEGSWVDERGTEYKADLVYRCVGIKQSSDWLIGSKEVELDNKGALKVDAHLRSEKNPSIFIIGDVNNVPEIKLGMFAMMQAGTTIKNLKKLMKDEKASLRSYSPKKPMGMIPIGKKKGAVGMFNLYPHFAISFKQKDLLIKMSMK
ncbi:MAG: hypothetical protein EOM67_07200 [Spirochaetia bacterium]|nr:hypothetical protein [Spirochaetia bacterium]